jgi:hypothetical protein
MMQDHIAVVRFSPAEKEAEEVFDDTRCSSCGFTFGLGLDQVLRAPEYRECCTDCYRIVLQTTEVEVEP